MDTDRYGRTGAEVTLPDSRSLNQEMVRRGMAWWHRKYAPADRELAGLEAETRAAKRGLWAQAGAVPPWNWRKGVNLLERKPMRASRSKSRSRVLFNG